jgi:hypothetical protein
VQTAAGVATGRSTRVRMTKQTSPKSLEGAQFVRYFGPLLDALRGLGGSGTPDEVVERIASDLKLSDEVQNELLSSGEPRYRNQVHWARFYLVPGGFTRFIKARRVESDGAWSFHHPDVSTGTPDLPQVGPDLSGAATREGRQG